MAYFDVYSLVFLPPLFIFQWRYIRNKVLKRVFTESPPFSFVFSESNPRQVFPPSTLPTFRFVGLFKLTHSNTTSFCVFGLCRCERGLEHLLHPSYSTLRGRTTSSKGALLPPFVSFAKCRFLPLPRSSC